MQTALKPPLYKTAGYRNAIDSLCILQNSIGMCKKEKMEVAELICQLQDLKDEWTL